LERRRWFLRWLLREIGFRFLVKVEGVEGLENLPESGPAIVMINHIAFVDPIVVLGCLPRNVVPLAKAEVYRYPLWGIFPRLWEVIPVRRGEVDRRALRQALEVLGAGEVLLVAPEGTRRPFLHRAKEGVAYLGYRSGAPVVPVAVEGTPGFPSISPARWRQRGAVVRLGRPFWYRPLAGKPSREHLRKMTDEAMYILAAMLPEARRGVYGDLEAATTDTIEFA
jgi:1-acyl-sn-glycerol-3-phosphate acyltransferase